MTVKPARAPASTGPQAWVEADAEDSADDANYKVLTREEVRAIQARQPALSPWVFVAAQGGVGLLMSLLWWLFTQSGSAAWSAFYGAIAVVVPSAVMAWGIGRRPAAQARAALFSLMLWEAIKILLVIAILVAVIKQVPDLKWAALLSSLVVCLKVNWLVLLTRGRFKSTSDGN